MKLISKTTALAVFMATAMLAVPAVAEENKHGFYIAPEISQIKIKDYCSAARTNLLGVTSCDESELGFGLSGGYRFNDHIAVEGGGRFASGFDVRLVDDFGDTETGKTDFRTFNLGVRATLPLGEHFALTSKAGVHFWNTEVKFSGGDKFDNDGTDPYFGAGIKFNFNENIGIMAEYSRYKFGNDDADIFSANVVFSF